MSAATPILTSVTANSGSTTERATKPAPLPRLGFLGVGWIGRHRLEAIASAGVAEIAALADPTEGARAAAAASAPGAEVMASFEALLTHPLDGIVIATPSALHAGQSITALERGFAVFCQKPLGRSADETGRVVATARRMNRLLGVDLSYREALAFRAVRDVVASGEIGEVYAADLTFHNAYGPDKPWFYDPVKSGGGCVMDLGIHLVDSALWMLGFPSVEEVSSRLYAGGQPLVTNDRVEDFATARMDLETGASLQLTCSWKLPAGRDAIISVTLYGTRGGVCVRNVEGSFYDFVAERFEGTHTSRLVDPPDPWGGRAAVRWAERLASGERFDSSAEELVRVSEILDRIYGR